MDGTIKIFTGRLVVTIEDDFHEVERFDNDKKLVKGRGYIQGDYVYVYRGKKEKFKKNELIPGIYKNIRGEYEFIHPESKQEKLDYSVDNVIEFDTKSIFDEISDKKEDFLDPEDIEVINNNQETFVPTFREEDDFLKYIVKKAILDKKVNLKNYKNKFPNQYALNNMKSGLNKETKMTVTNFKSWEEILGFKWKLIVEDAGTDRLSPLPEPIIVSSDEF
jgi:hypothetical protein